MKKALLYKPQNDGIDVNVAVYANEACLNLWRCTENPSECGGGPKPKSKNIFFCKRGENDNRICPKH